METKVNLATFSEAARQVLALAEDERRLLKHSYLGSEHILMGLLRCDIGIAPDILGIYNLDLHKVRKDIKTYLKKKEVTMEKVKIITKTEMRKGKDLKENHKCFLEVGLSYVTVTFCPKCGEDLRKEPEEYEVEKHICSECGTGILPSIFPLEEVNFCLHCGAKFEK